MRRLEVIKGVVSGIVGLGTAKIVHDIIDNNVDPVSATDKVTVYAGSMAAAGLAANATRKYTDAKIDFAYDFFRRIKENLAESQAKEK